MDKARDRIYSKHILEAIQGIETFTAGMAFSDFEKDIKTQLAVTRELEIIGEAAKRLSEEFKEKQRQIPRRKVAGMRDFLIHEYMKVDVKEVWKAATEDIKELKAAMEAE